MVEIYYRDINGNAGYMEFNYLAGNRYNFETMNEDDEILFVLLNGTCVYSALMAEPITWEELGDYFI